VPEASECKTAFRVLINALQAAQDGVSRVVV
jgi:hypothetical protein